MGTNLCTKSGLGRIVLAFVVIAIFAPHSAVAKAATALEQFEEEFVRIVESIIPAVVNIRSTNQPAPASKADEQERFSREHPLAPPLSEQFAKQSSEQPEGGSSKESTRPSSAMGAGVIVSHDGYIVTNSHVVKDMLEIKVTLSDKRIFQAKLIAADPESNLAVIKIDAQDLPTVKFGDSDRVRVGAPVLAVGNPFGLSDSVSFGIVSAKERTNLGILDYEDFIQTDAVINPGSGGGPLVSIRGEVIGIITALASRSGRWQGVGFAIPSNAARVVMEQLIETGEVKRGILGIEIQALDETIPTCPGRTDKKCALVMRVLPGSPGETAGIKADDIILEFNGQPINGPSHLKNLVSQSKPGSTAILKIYRNGKMTEATATLGERTKQAPAGAPPEGKR